MHIALHMACFCAAVTAGGGPALADEYGTAQPALTEVVNSGIYTLQATFDVDAGPHVVWEVLTDYDALPRFEPNVRKSVAGEVRAGKLLVTQEFEGKALIFTRDMNVRLEVQEQPERRLTFRDLSHEDFDLYQGSWQIQQIPAGSRVTYRLRSKPKGFVPPGIARGAFKAGAVEMLGQVRAEILRRAQISEAPQSPQANSQPEEGTAP